MPYLWRRERLRADTTQWTETMERQTPAAANESIPFNEAFRKVGPAVVEVNGGKDNSA